MHYALCTLLAQCIILACILLIEYNHITKHEILSVTHSSEFLCSTNHIFTVALAIRYIGLLHSVAYKVHNNLTAYILNRTQYIQYNNLTVYILNRTQYTYTEYLQI